VVEELAGQVAIVTGGGRGIGRAIALALVQAGAAVTVTARSADQVAETVTLIEQAGGRAFAMPAEVTDRDAVERMVAETERGLGPVDVLVNNAGVAGPVGPLWETDPDDWRQCVDINLHGPYLCCRAVLPGMIARGRGRIINVATAGVQHPGGYLLAYNCAKVGLVRLTEGLATSLKAHGVQVFVISPGAVHTAMSDELRDDEEKNRWMNVRAYPAKAWAPPERPALLCVLLASGKADQLSGRFVGEFAGVQDDIETLIRLADEVEHQDLYTLRRRTLS
jgi:NAD(P)-dependent dehydrogenase (short-subunit alcohol dehydrogenase family)